MAKELESPTKEFELTEAFWKKYKPDSVKETGLSSKLRDYEKDLANAEKLEGKGADEMDRNEAWVKVEQALHALTEAMPPTITALTKDKASHQNLKTSLDRAHKTLKGKSHPAYKYAEEKKIASRAQLPSSGKKDNLEWIDTLPPTAAPHEGGWDHVLEQFHQKAPDLPVPDDLKEPLDYFRLIDRANTLKKVKETGKVTEIEHHVVELKDQKQKFEAAIRKHVNELNAQRELGPWIAQLAKDFSAECRWWQEVWDRRPK